MRTDQLKEDNTAAQSVVKKTQIVYGVFKGMGDLLSAAPVMLSELNAGHSIHVLVFPQLANFCDLLDWGDTAQNLRVFVLPLSPRFRGVREFLRQMASLDPELVWISPHTPIAARSWKIPICVWLLKKRYWHRAKLAGAQSERFSWTFDSRIPVDRRLPMGKREWLAFYATRETGGPSPTAKMRFKGSIQEKRMEPPSYDLVILPGATAENRRWPFAKYAELVHCLSPKWRIAIAALPRDIASMKQVLPTDRPVTYIEGSLEEAIMTIARSRAALCMESGTMFFSNLLGVPTVAIFGISDPRNVIPTDESLEPVFEQHWTCQPCQKSRCSQQVAYCMTTVSASLVAAKLRKISIKFPTTVTVTLESESI